MAANGLPSPDTITRVVLDNGITALVYENFAAQSVVISGSLRAGSLYETPERNGLAALTASALMRGTENRDFNAIHAELEDIGADIGVSSSIHRTGFFGKALAEDLPTLVDVLADVLRRPTFPAAHVERLRGEVLTGLQYRSQDTRYRANRAFRAALYPDNHPYHYGTSGTVETVPQIAVSDMIAFHQQHYGPEDMIIVVVGAVKAAAVIDTLKQYLADWQNPSQPQPPALPEVPRVTESRREKVALPGKTQSDIVLGLPGPARFSDDYQAAVLANSVLGQFGMMGRIGASVQIGRAHV